MFHTPIYRRILPLTISACILFGVLIFPTTAAQNLAVEVSPGLSVLSNQTDVALSAFAGNDYVFSADAFAKGLNLSSVESVTVHSLPPVEDGELLLGSSRVVAGQTLSAKQFSNFNFHPSTEEAISTSFRFSANGSGTVMTCNLYFLNESNSVPTVNEVPTLLLLNNTFENKTAYAKLYANDPDSDSLRFEIVSYPKNGVLKLIDSANGNYEYHPSEGFTGKDSFRYVARDRYGNYSKSATVTLNVSKRGTATEYSDMKNSEFENAALEMAECGIMSGEKIGSNDYFYPEKEVSRAEFLVMSFHAAEISDLPNADTTVFADDHLIPSGMKAYVKAAYDLGYITAEESEKGLLFRPNDSITRAEASAMLAKILGIEGGDSVATFADESTIPAFAKSAMKGLYSLGIILSEEDALLPTQVLTRADCAQIFSSVLKYHK